MNYSLLNKQLVMHSVQYTEQVNKSLHRLYYLIIINIGFNRHFLGIMAFVR